MIPPEFPGLAALARSRNLTITHRLKALRELLVVSGHVSWVDIFALFRVFHRRAPFIRFFLKHQLIWFPIVGQAVWGLEFPFLRRRAEHRQKDFETARRAAQRYRHVPVAIATFLEGTRFSDNQVHPFNDGAAWLAIATRQKCVPMAISGRRLSPSSATSSG